MSVNPTLPTLPTLLPRRARTDLLDIAYLTAGEEKGRPVILLHGFPYDVRAFDTVAAGLAAQGARVIVPYLRGHGPTRFHDATTPRIGERAALGQDVIDLMDALHIPEAVLAGFDAGGRAASAAAALRPTRCVGLIASAEDRVADRAALSVPQPPRTEWDHWYRFYLLTERGRAGMARHRRKIARMVWRDQLVQYDDDLFDRSAGTFDNRDFVAVTVQGLRHQFGNEAGHADHADAERRIAQAPAHGRPALAIDALPQNDPSAWTEAALQCVRQGKWRT